MTETTKKVVIGFTVSTVGCLVADWLFHTAQLPEGLTPYWLAGGVWSAILFHKGESWLAYTVTLLQAMHAPGGAKPYASEYEFSGEG